MTLGGAVPRTAARAASAASGGVAQPALYDGSYQKETGSEGQRSAISETERARPAWSSPAPGTRSSSDATVMPAVPRTRSMRWRSARTVSPLAPLMAESMITLSSSGWAGSRSDASSSSREAGTTKRPAIHQ